MESSAERLSPVSTLEALSLWHKVAVRGLCEIKYDLSARQNCIMLSVYLSPPPHTVKNLAEQLKISKPAICRAVDVLSQLGLVKRKKDEKDKRQVMIQRTIKGSVYLSELGDIIVSATQEMGN